MTASLAQACLGLEPAGFLGGAAIASGVELCRAAGRMRVQKDAEEEVRQLQVPHLSCGEWSLQRCPLRVPKTGEASRDLRVRGCRGSSVVNNFLSTQTRHPVNLKINRQVVCFCTRTSAFWPSRAEGDVVCVSRAKQTGFFASFSEQPRLLLVFGHRLTSASRETYANIGLRLHAFFKGEEPSRG